MSSYRVFTWFFKPAQLMRFKLFQQIIANVLVKNLYLFNVRRLIDTQNHKQHLLYCRIEHFTAQLINSKKHWFYCTLWWAMKNEMLLKYLKYKPQASQAEQRNRNIQILLLRQENSNKKDPASLNYCKGFAKSRLYLLTTTHVLIS